MAPVALLAVLSLVREPLDVPENCDLLPCAVLFVSAPIFHLLADFPVVLANRLEPKSSVVA